MKLELLASGSPDCALIRLYEFNSKEAYQLRRIALQLARGKETTIPLHKESNVISIGGCELILRRGKKDRRVFEISSLKFEWALSRAGWRRVADLIRPFSRGTASGYQWLSEPGKVQILLSLDGKW